MNPAEGPFSGSHNVFQLLSDFSQARSAYKQASIKAEAEALANKKES